VAELGMGHGTGVLYAKKQFGTAIGVKKRYPALPAYAHLAIKYVALQGYGIPYKRWAAPRSLPSKDPLQIKSK
jgi:hypothetical protein